MLLLFDGILLEECRLRRTMKNLEKETLYKISNIISYLTLIGLTKIMQLAGFEPEPPGEGG